jgi:hypothetical protein
MKKQLTFWEIIGLLAWKYEGNDEKVVKPAIKYLSKQDDEFIFAFEEQIAEYLYAIDGRKWAESFKKANDGIFSDDGFLYCRCVAVINGEEYYNAILNGSIELNGDLEFESILSVPHLAWAKKHKKEQDDYPYFTETCYETGSNEELWI